MVAVTSLLDAPGTDASSELAAAVAAYLDHPRPVFTRLPGSYRHVPIRLRAGLLRALALVRPAGAADFPSWPIERRIDDGLRVGGRRILYEGKPAAIVITHDIDSREELSDIARLRAVEAPLGLVSSFGFVPGLSWPTEETARSLVDEGCEVYWHDIGHDGRLAYRDRESIVREFDRVVGQYPWALEFMRAFRAGQLVTSRALMDVVASRFQVDMSIPDTERHGPHGRSAGCGTVLPFRYGPLLVLPVTMPQEFYLLHVYGLSLDEALLIWTTKLRYIQSVGGVAVFNLHPVWVSEKYPEAYRAFRLFAELVASQTDAIVTTPTRLARAIEVTRA